MAEMRLPTATYRLQLNRRFRFADALSLVPYLDTLGISDLYASPVTRACSGSVHGYDVTDPTRLNPELGTAADFRALTRELKRFRMGLLLDIVPNHMALSPENPFWMDFLENGFCSPYARWFDVLPGAHGTVRRSRIVLPLLGGPLEELLRGGQVVLVLDDTGFYVKYHDHLFPLDIRSYGYILSSAAEDPQRRRHDPTGDLSRLEHLLEAAAALPSHPSARAAAAYRQRRKIKRELLSLLNDSKTAQSFAQESLRWLNHGRPEAERWHRMERLLDQQAYRLEFWKTGRKKINYRRFFDINDLIGVRVELPEVMEATHRLIFGLLDAGEATGLRIDHIDGLRYPAAYLRRLRERAGDLYVVVEKILGGDEDLPRDWPVAGTTSYDFMNKVNAMFVDGGGLTVLDEIYARSLRRRVNFDDLVYEKKKQVMQQLFPGEMFFLGRRLAALAGPGGGYTARELAAALAEVTACLPVYRTYMQDFRVSTDDRAYLEHAFREARKRNPDVTAAAEKLLRRVLWLDLPPGLPAEKKEAWLDFVLRWQQLTGSVMAKGFEDTALYAYSRLVSPNEVGGAPREPATDVARFHRWNAGRLASWPHTLNATSTHDSKRSEDVRARINVLSELPAEWAARLSHWRALNRAKRHRVKGRAVPGPDMELLCYQTLLGAWPLRRREVAGFAKRLQAYLVKAAREAKTFTSWLAPDPRYEDALCDFARATLTPGPDNAFLRDFLPFFEKVAFYGALNSLAQVLLKVTLPGVPDFYQGTELWDFSLVDPDNRRPVDFTKRQRLVEELVRQKAEETERLCQRILQSWDDGRVKLYLTCKSLHFRRENPDLFRRGAYVPLEASGTESGHIFAFARRNEERWAAVVVPRFSSGLVPPGTFPTGRAVWKNETLQLPAGCPPRWRNVITGEELESVVEGKLAVADVLSLFPLALLESR